MSRNPSQPNPATPPSQPATTNEPPVIYPLVDQTTHPGDVVTFSVGAFDPDDDDLTYSIVQGPGTIDASSGLYTWDHPQWSDLGTHMVTIRVTDPHGEFDQTSCAIRVENAPPQMAPVPDKNTHPGEQLDFVIGANDPDDDPLTFSLEEGPAGANIDSATGRFTWNPGWGDLGNHSITVKVSDPDDSDQQTFTIRVLNAPPVLGQLMDHEVMVGEQLTFTAQGSDPDNDQLTYSLEQGPAGAALAPATGQFSWTPGAADIGNHTVTIKVSDPQPLSAQESCTVRVRQPQQPPQ